MALCNIRVIASCPCVVAVHVGGNIGLQAQFLVVEVQNPEAPGHSVIGCYLLDVHLVAFAVASR